MDDVTSTVADAGRAVPIAVAVVEHDDRFLIGQRPPGVVLAGFWEFPGGKVFQGESAEEAAVRECREETGIEVEALGTYGQRLYHYDHGAVRLHFVACRPHDPLRPPSAPFRWVERQDLSHYHFPPANEDLLGVLMHGTPTEASRGNESP
jgi:mutator protein MutT